MRTHGRVSTYNHGCRCVLCLAAMSDYRGELRARTGRRHGGRAASGRPVLEDPMRWTERAACRDIPKTVFFPEGGTAAYRQAKSICAACPVTDECLSYALRTHQHEGCWGGLAPDERYRKERAS